MHYSFVRDVLSDLVCLHYTQNEQLVPVANLFCLVLWHIYLSIQYLHSSNMIEYRKNKWFLENIHLRIKRHDLPIQYF